MNALETRKTIQGLLAVDQDGVLGVKTATAYSMLSAAPDESEWPPLANTGRSEHHGKASSFADPADIRRFRTCKAEGKSDQECFKVGDNGIGKWGDDCSEGSGPRVALPPEDWQEFGASARGKKVLIQANGREVICELRDTMPHRANIKNGAIIDMNPDACKALGLIPPVIADAIWSWV